MSVMMDNWRAGGPVAGDEDDDHDNYDEHFFFIDPIPKQKYLALG